MRENDSSRLGEPPKAAVQGREVSIEGGHRGVGRPARKRGLTFGQQVFAGDESRNQAFATTSIKCHYPRRPGEIMF